MDFNQQLCSVLNELFDQQVGLTWNKKSIDTWEANFEIDGKKYKVSMVRDMISPRFYMPWEVTFCLLKDFPEQGKCSHEITGTGNAPQVFATVLSAIREWMNEVLPVSFMLSAAEKSRSSLYKRMISKMMPKSYDVDVHHTSSTGTTFEISRKDSFATDAYGLGDESGTGRSTYDEKDWSDDTYGDYDSYDGDSY